LRPTSRTVIAGWRRRKAETGSCRRHGDGALNVPIATAPPRSDVSSPTLSVASSSARSARVACSANARPLSVSRTPRPVRRNRSAPSTCSSLRICSATAGCETRSRSAAAVNEPVSAAAQKHRTCCRE
jgi:hypothetical protein